MPDAGLQWFVVYTGVRQELRAAENLRSAGYQVFLPLMRLGDPYRRRGRYRAVFPRYLFLGMGEHLPVSAPVADRIGVERVLDANGEWLSVPGEMLAPLIVDDATCAHDERIPAIRPPGAQRRRPRPRSAPARVKRNIQRLRAWLDARRRAMQ